MIKKLKIKIVSNNKNSKLTSEVPCQHQIVECLLTHIKQYCSDSAVNPTTYESNSKSSSS